ncbi:NmrA/HSCARG family protein [Actinoplanes sp. NBRC 103695]|uniref:NmrA/HSCARG family protein n=1 Tax=Actinoplanes sp. NBRC 103695 TaxID=3032202 RepID=UPI0024A4EFC0|nr:NmrA/HSCARG family protein [Actinoplanes sp. NBRC 103695]GLZ02274.1 nucleotide-diphosphate-sugar epimerase [Actinoplanes sp. NBRC 103695]
MPAKKTIVVLGATGYQGGGLAQAALGDPSGEFAVRAVTRDPDSQKARALAALGAEVVSGDIGDEGAMTRILEGADGAFLVTFFWEHMAPGRETAEAASLARAAKAAGVPHVIWSTLEDTRQQVPLTDDRMPTLEDSYKVPHYDAKGEADRFFAELEVPTTYLRTSVYWESFVHYGLCPMRDDDGTMVLTLPIGEGRLATIAAEDIGRSALEILRRGQEFLDRTVGIAGGHLSGEEFAQGFAAALGEPVQYRPLTPAQYRALGTPAAQDLGNMFQYSVEFEDSYCGIRDIDLTRSLNPRLLTFPEWAVANKDKIPR